MKMEKLIANLSNKVQRRVLAGRNYLVAPVVMLLEGVFAGSEGPILYEGQEILKSVTAWNYRPITVGHPEKGGAKISGCTEEALNDVGLGFVLNARWNKKTSKLAAEAWFDEERLSTVPEGSIIREALDSGRKLEVSTGLFVDALVANGEHAGKTYRAIAKNFQPDHLAILLDQEGACSLADGAGLLVNKKARPKCFCPRSILTNAKSENLLEIVEELQSLVAEAHTVVDPSTGVPYFPELEEVREDYVIFELDERVYKEKFAVKDGVVTLDRSSLEEVKKIVTYKSLATNKANQMTRDELTKELGDNFKDFVANMSDDQVAAVAKLRKTEVREVVKEVAKNPVVNSVNDVLAFAPEAVRDEVQEGLAARTSVRENLISTIVANAQNQFTRDELSAMKTDVLTKLSGLAVTNAKETKPATVYAGSAPSNQGSAPVAEEGFAVPSSF